MRKWYRVKNGTHGEGIQRLHPRALLYKWFINISFWKNMERNNGFFTVSFRQRITPIPIYSFLNHPGIERLDIRTRSPFSIRKNIRFIHTL